MTETGSTTFLVLVALLLGYRWRSVILGGGDHRDVVVKVPVFVVGVVFVLVETQNNRSSSRFPKGEDLVVVVVLLWIIPMVVMGGLQGVVVLGLGWENDEKEEDNEIVSDRPDRLRCFLVVGNKLVRQKELSLLLLL